ncbi:MAG: transposase [Burkholderiales bacterium]|nr:transposase [Burkholderiales bacterium]
MTKQSRNELERNDKIASLRSQRRLFLTCAEVPYLGASNTKHCPKCGVESKLTRIQSRRAYACKEGCHVYPCVGTPFEHSSTPLTLVPRYVFVHSNAKWRRCKRITAPIGRYLQVRVAHRSPVERTHGSEGQGQ